MLLIHRKVRQLHDEKTFHYFYKKRTANRQDSGKLNEKLETKLSASDTTVTLALRLLICDKMTAFNQQFFTMLLIT